MNRRKEFSVLKFIIFPLNSIILSAVIAWFNLSVFGFEDGAPYTAIVALIGLFSIIIVKYAESTDKTLARAAFVFEIFLTVALIINAAYSISVQRKMSVARMAETSQSDTIDKISKLRGSRTQREALKMVEKTESPQSVFASVEQVLFWIAVGELFLYGIAAFSLFAIARLRDEDPRPLDEEFPAYLETEKRASKSRMELVPKTTTQSDTVSLFSDDTDAQRKTTRVVNREGLKRLRETLKEIAFAAGKTHFKCDPKPDIGAIWIRQMKSSHGVAREVASAKAKLSILDDAMAMPRDQFRERLEKFLRQSGFEI